jgi:ATP-dependent RNA helicase SUPV3L1/SUV3
MCVKTKDSIEIIQYERLSPLVVGNQPLKDYKYIQKGDCVIGFSRNRLYDIKSKIESQNKSLKCCIIYGNLPPTTRKEQAKLFNSLTSGYDVLVASDAIGMGLNLSIKRIIMSSLDKFDGRNRRDLYSSEVKQISGRAGRYYEQGEVITFSTKDMDKMKSLLSCTDLSVRKAGLSPCREQLEIFGIFSDVYVTESELQHFWSVYHQSEWDTSLDTSHRKSQVTIGTYSMYAYMLVIFRIL